MLSGNHYGVFADVLLGLVERFKKVNHVHEHEAGDRALVMFLMVMQGINFAVNNSSR